MSAAMQGLRAVHDCGAIYFRRRMPEHLKAALEMGWVELNFRRLKGQWRGCLTLAMPHDRAANMLASVPMDLAA